MHYLGRVVFFALLSLILLAAIPYGTAEPWWIALFECGVFVLGVVWFVEGLLSERWHLHEHALLIPLLGLVLLAFYQTLPLASASHISGGIESRIATTLSADPMETRRFALRLLALILTGQLLLHYTSTERRLRALIYTIIAVGVASALFGILRQTMQRDSPSFVLPYLTPNTGYAQFINRNHFAFLMEMTLGLVLGLIVGGGVRRDRLLFYLAAAAPLWAALVLSNSRGGILSMVSQALFLALMFTLVRPARGFLTEQSGVVGRLWRFGRLFIVRAALIIGVIVLVGISVVWIGSDPVVSRIGSASSDFNVALGNTSRGDIWRASWSLFKAHPVIGAGFGGYWIAITEHHQASGEFAPQQAHNDYLELLTSGGLIGAALGAWFLIAFILRARRSLRSPDSFRRAACLGALAGLFGVAVHSFVDFGLHITVNALVVTALVAIAILDISPAEHRSEEI